MNPIEKSRFPLGCLGTLGVGVIVWGIFEQSQGIPDVAIHTTSEPLISTPIPPEVVHSVALQWESWGNSLETYGAWSVPVVALLVLGTIIVLNLPRVRYKGSKTLLRLDSQTSIDLTTTDRRNIGPGMKVERQLPHPENGAWIPDFAAEELRDLYRRVKH